MRNTNNIIRIKAPKFRVGKLTLNEYEVRQLMVEVAKGWRAESLIEVRDEDGTIATIGKDGHLSQGLRGLKVGSDLTMELIRTRRENERNQAKRDIVSK